MYHTRARVNDLRMYVHLPYVFECKARSLVFRTVLPSVLFCCLQYNVPITSAVIAKYRDTIFFRHVFLTFIIRTTAVERNVF